MSTQITTLYYFHDPMCSWCWAFRPVWQRLLQHMPDTLRIEYVEGGLAADSDQPMPDDVKAYIQNTWRRIEKEVPGTDFNYDFWTECQPRRSTYPACRALIAADKLGHYEEMLMAIQEAYYLHAQNPSDEEVLVNLAVIEGMEEDNFRQLLHSRDTEIQLQEKLLLCRKFGVNSFPSLILAKEGGNIQIPIDYHSHENILTGIKVFS